MTQERLPQLKSELDMNAISVIIQSNCVSLSLSPSFSVCLSLFPCPLEQYVI